MSNRASGRLIDPRGHRFGAALSVVILVLGFVLAQPIVVPLVALLLGLSAALGTNYSALGRPWPLLRRLLRIEPPRELESEYPPRFAQALGSFGLAAATAALIVGAPVVGWLVAAGVAGLQSILALTGFCLGCRLYFLRWWLPATFARLVRAGRADRSPS